MAKVDLASVHKVTAKGRIYYYAWRGKGAPRLKSEPGTPAFVTELANALAGRKAGGKGLVSGLITEYKDSDWWRGLAPATHAAWGPWLDTIRDRFGGLRVAVFGLPDVKPLIRKWRDQFRDRPRTADMGMQVLSRLMAFAVYRGDIPVNPCAGIDQLYESNRSDLIWTPADFAELEAVASKEVFTAARLAALTSLRRSDLLRLSWSHIGPLAIEMRTGKSRGKKTTLIPIYGELRALLDAIPRRATTVLTNTAGRPWQTGFSASWQKSVNKAGLDLHFHDLRGTAATRFYMADLSIREIAEIMTWAEDRVEALINRYVKRDEILKDRIRRLDENRRRTDP